MTYKYFLGYSQWFSENNIPKIFINEAKSLKLSGILYHALDNIKCNPFGCF